LVRVSGPVLEPESAMGIQTVLVWAQESAMGIQRVLVWAQESAMGMG
jgi:hypothetical protein